MTEKDEFGDEQPNRSLAPVITLIARIRLPNHGQPPRTASRTAEGKPTLGDVLKPASSARAGLVLVRLPRRRVAHAHAGCRRLCRPRDGPETAGKQLMGELTPVSSAAPGRRPTDR